MELIVLYTAIFIVVAISIIYYTYLCPEEEILIKREEKIIDDYIKSAQTGMIKGLIFGITLGDYVIADGIKHAAINAVVHPIVMYFGY
jgi:hypothetical protein